MKGRTTAAGRDIPGGFMALACSMVVPTLLELGADALDIDVVPRRARCRERAAPQS